MSRLPGPPRHSSAHFIPTQRWKCNSYCSHKENEAEREYEEWIVKQLVIIREYT
jgi:hypothetical protein